MKIPEYYLPVMPYLILNRAQDFLTFAKKVFNAQEMMIVPGENGGVMHGELKINDGAVIMFAQATDQWNEKSAGMFIYVDSVDRVYEAALAEGAKSLTEPVQQDYGYTAGFEDPFGNQWWLSQAE